MPLAKGRPKLREGDRVSFRKPGGDWEEGTFDSWRSSDGAARVLSYDPHKGTVLTIVHGGDIKRR